MGEEGCCIRCGSDIAFAPQKPRSANGIALLWSAPTAISHFNVFFTAGQVSLP
jgi:hypothetical protein